MLIHPAFGSLFPIGSPADPDDRAHFPDCENSTGSCFCDEIEDDMGDVFAEMKIDYAKENSW